MRPDPAIINRSFYTNYGKIRYKGLLVDLTKRFSKGFSGGVAYTLSKTDNNAFNFVSGVQVPSQSEPKSFNLDATLQKRFAIGRHGLRLTLEAFNALNIPQRTAPNAQILNPTLFGTYTAVTQPRAMQFTLQYDF